MKKVLFVLFILTLVTSGLFATRISVTYNGTQYILLTSKTITDDNVAYFNGMYDAFAAAMEGKQLHEIYNTISAKSFTATEGTDAAQLKQEYEEAFLDCMTNYSYGTEGAFKDIYPIYRTLMSRPISYQNAQDIVYYGSARFYVDNI